MRVLNALLLPVMIVSGAPAMAGVIAPPPGPPPPVHELIQELEGDYSDYTAQDDVTGPRFGFSTAMYGDTLAVGAPNARPGATDTPHGVVFIFRLQGSQWQLHQRISFDPPYLRECGYAVSLDARNLLIGCPGAGSLDGDDDIGWVRRYARTSPVADFEYEGRFNGSQGLQPGQRCGQSVALLGAEESGSLTFAAVGCPGRDNRQGMADIHVFCPLLHPCNAVLETGWNHVADFSPPPGVPEEPRFGASLSFGQHGGDLLLAVGQPGFPNAGGSPNGRAEVLRMGDAVDDWSLEQTYEGDFDSRLGFSIHLKNEWLIAGAPTLRDTSTIPVATVGGFQVARRECVLNPFPDPPDCSWGEAEEFVGEAILLGAPHRLGHAVHVLATGGFARVIAGEPAWPANDYEGRAQHYYRESGEWVLNEDEPFYTASMPAPSALGSSLSGDGNWLAIGAPGYVDPDVGPRGRVLVYAYNNALFSDRFEDLSSP